MSVINMNPKPMTNISNKKTDVALGNLYDLNKNLVKQFKEVNPMELAAAQERVKNWMITKVNKYAENQYFMFICREKYDYTLVVAKDTIFKKDYAMPNACKEVIAAALNRGKIVDICKDEHETAYEFWIKTEDSKNDEDVNLYLLIPYNNGVIEVE